VDQSEPIDFVLDSTDGQALAWLYRHGRVAGRSEDEDGALTVSVRLDEQALGQFERQFPSAHLKLAAE
jgi:GTP-binding protein HflX